ncbi:hypothetical protein GOARA_061_01070 [Gordonia araii NBRC 100433]|uniref:Uncharacterized protein n=1 Tax=Gordonia araii NBRC 100433 TaxID=1073574 RepID=G7H493_9ACTN|nr:hypothetical protein GOARA_061_01070 [Gordonia araii NBRC 100433]
MVDGRRVAVSKVKVPARGSRLRVRYANGEYEAKVLSVHGDRVSVAVDPDSDSPIRTVYRLRDLTAS